MSDAIETREESILRRKVGMPAYVRPALVFPPGTKKHVDAVVDCMEPVLELEAGEPHATIARHLGTFARRLGAGRARVEAWEVPPTEKGDDPTLHARITHEDGRIADTVVSESPWARARVERIRAHQAKQAR